MSYDGATIDGVQYKGVDRASVSEQVRKQMDVCGIFAEETGIDLGFFEGESDTKGAYLQGGKIYLNVNNSGSMGEALIVSTFSHELTHFAEEYGGTAYEELRGYVVQALAEGDTARFEQLVEAKRKARGGISYEEALSEVVADGCETMLRDTHAPERLARENPTLLQKICDWLDGWVKKIKAAFTGVEARHPEAKALMETAEALQTRWDKALAEAVQNRETLRKSESAEAENENARSENENARSEHENARSENKMTADDGGRVQYSIDPGFAKAIDEWDGKKDKTFRLGSTSKALQSIGVKDTGIIWHSRKINKILREHPDMSKEIIKQVPNILENPVMVLQSQNSESRIVMMGEVYDEAGNLITAVLELQPTAKGGQIQDMTVVVSAYGKNDSPQNFIIQSNLLYIDPNKKRTNRWMQGLGLQLPSDTTAFGSIGNITYQDGEVKINSIPYKQYMQTEREDVDYTTKVPATKSPGQIAYEKAQAEKAERIRKEQEKKAREQKSERDNSVSDRELLREAAEHEGASEELKKYARKADNLEAYQRRLERQEKKLAEMREEAKTFKDPAQLDAARERIEKSVKSRKKTLAKKTEARDELRIKVDDRVQQLAKADPPARWAQNMVKELEIRNADVDKAEKRLDAARAELDALSLKSGTDSEAAKVNAREAEALKKRIADTEHWLSAYFCSVDNFAILRTFSFISGLRIICAAER